MLSQAWMTSRRALSRGGTWTVSVWSALFILLFVGGLLAAGARTLLTAMLHPQIIGGTPTLATSTMGHNLIGILIIYLVAIGIGPFYLAGVYGLLGLAVQGQTVSWRTFWAMGRRCYGRTWGLYLYFMIYSVALMVPLVIFIGLGAVLATGASGSGGILAAIGLGALLLILAGIGSMPWILRMAGGLFVDQYTWGRSFKLSFSGRHYWAIFGSMLLSMLVYSLVLALMLLLINLLGVLGIVLYGCLYLVLGVVVPVWFFALYTATRNA